MAKKRESNLPAEEQAIIPSRNPRGVNQYTAPPKDIKAFRKAIKDGLTIQKSMLAAGFPESTARQGVRKLPLAFLKALRQEKQAQIALAKEFTPQDTADYVAGGLIANTIDGHDRAVRSYELLGKMKTVNLFQSEATQGVFIIEMPAHLAAQMHPQVVDGE